MKLFGCRMAYFFAVLLLVLICFQDFELGSSLNVEGRRILGFREELKVDPRGLSSNRRVEVDGDHDPCSRVGVSCEDGRVISLKDETAKFLQTNRRRASRSSRKLKFLSSSYQAEFSGKDPNVNISSQPPPPGNLSFTFSPSFQIPGSPIFPHSNLPHLKQEVLDNRIQTATGNGAGKQISPIVIGVVIGAVLLVLAENSSNYSLSRRLSNLHFQLAQSSYLGRANPIYFTLSLPPRVTNHVTSVPVDDVDTTVPEFDSRGVIVRLKALQSRLQNANSLQEKIRVLDSDSRVRMLFGKGGRGGDVFPTKILVGLGMWEMFLVKCLVAAGQGHVVGLEVEVEDEGGGGESSGLKTAFRVLAGMVEKWGLNGEVNVKGLEREGERGDLKELLRILGEVEQFYDCIGGIIGYHITVLELLLSSRVENNTLSHHLDESVKHEMVEFHIPRGVNLLENTDYASQAALWGIEGLPRLGEIYPLGSAGDRLGLIDQSTGECLPAAMLPYCGRTLLEGLIRDLQAREFLYFKLYGKQCITPVAIMASSVKNNHAHITTHCERLNWFGRGRRRFQLFEQPLVPVVASADGQWLVSKPFSPVCKPGGHGAIWKLAHEKGVFKWFYAHGREGVTIRQVSNVVAAIDVTMLALAGVGLHHRKKLGFASCQRISGATEGINVLFEKRNLKGQWEYGLTCVEYTEFEKYDIKSDPTSTNSLQSEFPANTNILYVDLPSAERIGSCRNVTCLPGMVLNLKKPVPFVDHFGIQRSQVGQFQAIYNSWKVIYAFVNELERLDTFIVYNERKRVTSSAKRKRKQKDKSLHQTPDGSLLDIIRNAADILSPCGISIPKIEDNSKYIHSRPPFLILLYPALGPLWEVTRQKFNGGSISEGSELQVEVAEFSWKNVQLDGSLIVFAENVMGSTRMYENDDPILHFGYRCGRCKFENVKVLNKGIDWDNMDNVYWKDDLHRFETLRIILHGNAEFEARDVILKGNQIFEVPDGFRMSITSCNSDSGFYAKLDPIREELMDSGSWFWRYKTEGTHIKLEMEES